MNLMVATIDWHTMFVPSASLWETVIRASVMYLLILAGFRVFRREAGSLSVSDLLVVVLIADAAQNGLAGEYKSITEGAVIVATIFAWDYSLDWLSYRSPFVASLLSPPPIPLICDGTIQHRNLRRELISKDELMAQLREQGIEDPSAVKRCYLEGDGRLSVIKKEGGAPKAGGRKGDPGA